MQRGKLKQAIRNWIATGQLPKFAKARQLQELHRNMCRKPAEWGLPVNFGREPNTDWKTLWMTLNLERFNLPWDPRTMEKGWSNLPEEWLIALHIDNRLKPVDIAGKFSRLKLRSDEAHQWLCHVSSAVLTGCARSKRRNRMAKSGLAIGNVSIGAMGYEFQPPHIWLLKKVTKLNDVARNIHSRLIINWIAKKMNTESFKTPIFLFNAYGWKEEIHLVRVLDEIYEHDLVQGVRTSPEWVKKKIKERRGGDYADKLTKLNKSYPRFPEYWPALPNEIEHIANSARLAKEGLELEHCVMSYHDRIVAGNSFIFSVNVNGRSTFEMDPHGRMTQHQAFRHARASQDNTDVMNKWLKQFKIINV